MKIDDLMTNLDALNHLLEAEREILLTGKLDGLADIVETKEYLIEAVLGSKDAAPDALRLLDQKVRRNQMLLDGALDGIRTVARRLATLRRVRMSLDTYDATGVRQAIDIAASPSIERRA